MKRVFQIIRLLFALFFIYSSLGVLLGFAPPPKLTGMAGQLAHAMVASGYLMTFVKLTELAAGVLLLFDLLAPLGLVILAPLTLNILFFNLFLNPSLIFESVLIILVHLALAWNYRYRYLAVFQSKEELTEAM